MGWLKLCDDDPLVKTMSQVFRANIIRVPEARLQPLSVLAARDGRLAYRGKLADLVAGEVVAELVTPAFETGTMADVSGKRSRKISVELGLDILKGFLSGFGVPAAAGLAEQFSGASEVSFSFSQVRRVYIDPARLGRLLAGRTLDRSNAVVSAFLQEDPWECLIVDSVITSQDFTINVDRQNKQDFKFDVPAIENLLSKAKANIELFSASTYSLTFKGPEPLAFAFSCQPLILDEKAAIVQMPPELRDASVWQAAAVTPGAAQRTPGNG